MGASRSRSAAASAPVAATATDSSTLRLTVTLASGRSEVVEVAGGVNLRELREEIHKVLDVPVKTQRLLESGRELKGVQGSTLVELGLQDGARIDVICVRWVPPVLPAYFRVTMNIVLEEVRFPSSLPVRYDLEVDVPNAKVVVSQWRKNEQDKMEYDFASHTFIVHRGHWMAGTQTNTTKLHTRTPLPELLQAWLEIPVHLQDEAPFWTSPCLAQKRHAKKINPLFRPNQFVLPEGDFTELVVDTAFVRPLFRSFVRIHRLLVDADGMPIRAVLFHQDPGSVDEYEISFEAMPDSG